MSTNLERCSWALERAGEAVEALARASHLSDGSAPSRIRVHLDSNSVAIGSLIEREADRLGLEVEPVEVLYGEMDEFLARAAPALVLVTTEDTTRLLLLVRSTKRKLLVLDPELAVRSLSPAIVRSSLCFALESSVSAEIERILVDAGVPRRQLQRSRESVLRERLCRERIGGCYLLRLPLSADSSRQVRHARLPSRLVALVTLHGVEYALWMLSWWMVGKGALEGNLDRGWLLAWGLLVLTLIPLRLQLTAAAGRIAIDAGSLLKGRLFLGALRLDPEAIRREGVGRLLSRVIESEAVESLAISGGLLALLSLVEIALALLLFVLACSSWFLGLMLIVWVGVTLAAARKLLALRRNWTETRLHLTHELVEKMVGHRTRLAQENPNRWHEGEDRSLEHYHFDSERMDRWARLVASIPRAWLVVGIFGLALRFVPGSVSPALLAVTLGGILVSYRALRTLVLGLSDLLGAHIGWKQVVTLFAAAGSPVRRGSYGATSSKVDDPIDPEPVISAQDLWFRYRDRGEPVLRGLSLRIARGDRLLLEGPSGSGKSTLCSLLTGLRSPESGLLLQKGLDLSTAGDAAWRRCVAAAPQFHENHILSSTLAFNLLMGRAWPPSEEDLVHAESICAELGLEPLLKRMPSGLQQMVGETGWQLSHGERSRIYIARALLQNAELVLLDESFAALDPKTLRKVVDCVNRRARTLLVIAHP